MYLSTHTCHAFAYRIYTLILVLLTATACSESWEHYSTDPGMRLSFSSDTLKLDTVLTNIPTSTRLLKVYNRQDEALLISSIDLAGNSGFRINVDGQKGYHFSNVEIAARDSLHIFVEATLASTGQPTPTLVKDSILFMLNGNRQEVKLTAYAQDAYSLRAHRIATDTVIQTTRPLLIYDSLSVAPNARLTLGPGTQLYFHSKAVMHIHGQLTVNGTLQQPVVFRGDRTDKLFSYLPYDRLPGQWGGIVIHPTSFNNSLDHAEIRGAETGIRCDSSSLQAPKLNLTNSRITQASTDVLSLNHCLAQVTNSELSNAGRHCLSLQGGQYTFVHCTVANFFSWNSRQGTSLYAAHTDEATAPCKATFVNCLITGSNTTEANLPEMNQQQAACQFQNTLLKAPADLILTPTDYPPTLIQQDAFTAIDTQAQYYNFVPTDGSPAIDAANAQAAQPYPLDRNGHNRLTDAAPDAGCYEAPQEEAS